MANSKPTLVKPQPWIEEPSLNIIMKCQQEFHEKFQISLNESTQQLYASLIEEEHEEWIEDYYNAEASEYQELKELADLLYVTSGLAYQMQYSMPQANKYIENSLYAASITNLVSEVAQGSKEKKLLSNLIYCLYGYADSMQWDLNEAFIRVHNSNLTKLDDNGKPIRREDGKVTKGPNYKPPHLEDLTHGR